MAENSRSTFSPASSSPSRLPPIARPDWPWAARSYSQRSGQSSPHPSLQGSNLVGGSSWEQRSSISSSSNQSGYSGSAVQLARQTSTPKPAVNPTMGFPTTTESTRQWTFTGFEWAVRDVHKLRDFVEGVNSIGEGGQLLMSDHGDFEILKQSPMLGDSKFKLEIAPTVPPDGTLASNVATLSLYITSLMVDFAQDDYEVDASMMAAIKCQDDRAGERGARPEWVWEFWQNDWVFRRGSEVWECPLPSLSSLLENPRIRDTDSLVICIQIHSPVGPSIPQQPSVYYVPKDLLDGLEASLDNQNTGDVRFICLERYNNHDETPGTGSEAEASVPDVATSPFNAHASARKRIIYAHSDILVRRSEYFATMLSSAFSENTIVTTGERKLYTVVVEEADFETMYWLLKYCYANWLLFRQHDDPRAAVEGVGAGWSVRSLAGQRGEWDWKPFHRGGTDDACDSRSATSGESLAHSHTTSAKSDVFHQTTVTSSRPAPLAKPSVPPSTTRQSTSASTSASARRTTMATPGTSNAVSAVAVGASSNIPRVKPGTVPTPTAYTTPSHYPVSPRSARPSGLPSTPDPHPHPTPAPGPASALAIYQVSHRYAMPTLASLALDHVMSTITPQTSFALLLATSLWDELHGLIEDFVVERWDDVSASSEFEQCCKEVAAGEWGPDGGKTLMSVFRRLRSPTNIPA